MPSTPPFAFGHGLSYTTFEYSPLKLARPSVDVSGDARVTLTIANTGKRRGTEVVLLYAADAASGVTLPAQQLIGFIRVDLEPGASKRAGLHGTLQRAGHGARANRDQCRQRLRRSLVEGHAHVTGKTRTIRGEDRKFFSVATVGQ